MRSILIGIRNLVDWFSVIWKYRWWDYGFTLAVIRRDLELKYKEWGVNTHYVGDEFTKKRIAVLIRLLDKYDKSCGMVDEYNLLKKFMKMYSRNIARLWD